MKILRLHIVFLLLVLQACPLTQADEKVLFIGNSYTQYNKLPALVQALAGGPHAMTVDQATPGGFTLERHLQEGPARSKITAAPWDWIVFQEQSMRPVVEAPQMLQAGESWSNILQDIPSKKCVYMTWPRKTKPEMLPGLIQSYEELGQRLNAKVAPVGMAWETLRKSHPEIELYAGDGSHPSPAGSYLAACVIYATLSGTSPVGKPTGHLTLEFGQVQTIQSTAWQTVREYTPGLKKR